MSGIANVTSPPYDVISGGSLANLRAADPHNVVRLILPGEGPDAAAALLGEWLSSGILIRDREPGLYLYSQQGAGFAQRGIIGLVRLGDPDESGILPHEDVFPPVVAGRRRLMSATKANLEPIFLVYDGGCGQTLDRIASTETPLLTVTTDDGVAHQLWRISEPGDVSTIAGGLSGRPALIADGHHRYAAYLELRDELRAAGHGAGPWDYGLAYLVDSATSPVRLGAIHRVLPGLSPDRAAELGKAAFTVQVLPSGSSGSGLASADLASGTDLAAALARLAAAGRDGTAFLLAGADGYRLLTHPDPLQVAAAMPDGASAAWQRLDAAVLQQLLMAQLWGIPDTDPGVQVSHDASEAVASAGSSGTAVLVNPVQFEAVHAIASRGERVPRKSTSFGPKPRTGLVLRTL